MTHRHLSQDELVDRVLARRSGEREPSERRLACARCSGAEVALAAFLERCRASAESRRERAAAGASDAALVARILARTAREDLGWRGDLELVAGFLRQRLCASRALRLLAASLALHLLVLPVCAWLALCPEVREPSLVVRIEPREQALPDVPEEPVRALEAPLLPEPQALEPDPFAVQRRLERAQLEGRPCPAAGGNATSGAGRLFELRAARDGERVRRGAERIATALERALWVEVLIDHLVLAGERLPDLDLELERLGVDPTLTPGVLWVEALVLERAAGLGLLEGSGAARLGDLAATLAQRLPRAELGQPLGARGFGRALEAALGAEAGPWAAWDR